MVSHSRRKSNFTGDRLLLATASHHPGDKVKSLMPDDIAQSIVSETILVPLRKATTIRRSWMRAIAVALLSGKPDPGPPQIAEMVKTEGTFKKAEETDGNATIW